MVHGRLVGAVTEPIPDEWVADEVVANGVRLAFLRTGGPGRPLVVAHGLYDDARCRLPLIRALADEYDVIAYDARGHGRSAAPADGYAVADRVDDLLGLLDALSIAEPLLLGHSTGGNTALAAAARRPDLPRAVVGVDPAGLLDIETDPATRERHTRERIDRWHDHTAEELLAADDGIRARVEEGEAALARRLADARLRVDPNAAAAARHGFADPAETYPAVEAPTLILRADGAAERRRRDRERCERLADGRLVHVEGAGHTVVRDARRVATAEVRAFLSAQS